MSVDTSRAQAIDLPRPARRSGAPPIYVRLGVALVATVIAFACAVVAFAGPADVHRARITWQPGLGTLDRPLALAGAYPQRLSVTLNCTTVRTLPAETTLVKTAIDPASSSGLAIVADAQAVRLAIGANTRLLSLSVPPTGPCAVAARFVAHEDTGRFSLRVGTRTVTRTVPHHLDDVVATEASWPRVVALHADPLVGARHDLVVKLETTPTGSSPTDRQLVAEILALVALAVAGIAVLGGGREVRTSPSRRTTGADRSPRVAVSDLAVLGVAGVAIVLTPPFWDDGWVRATIGGFSELGNFSNYYTQADFAQPLGYWWVWLTHAWSGSEQSLVVLRFAPLVVILASWWFLRRFVLDSVFPGASRAFARGIAALVFALGSATYLMTLRPEPVIALLETLALVAAFRFSREPGPRPLLALGALGALALTAHQTGWVVALSALAMVPSALRWSCARDRVARVTSLVIVGLFSLALALLLLGLDSDWHLVRSGIASFRAGDSYRIGVFDLPRQRFDYLQFVAGLQRFWPALAVLLAVVFVFIGYGIRIRAARTVGYAALAGYAGLLFTGSPWPWHFGAIVPAAALLAALGTTRLLALGRAGVGVLIGMGVATSIALAWAMESTRLWTAGDLAEHSWAALPQLSGWEWAVLAIVAAGLGGFAARRRRGKRSTTRGAVMAAAVFLLCAPLALTWGLLLIDATETSGWSYARQTLDEITSRDRCGVADSVRVVTDATPLAETRVDRAALPPASLDAYPQSIHTAAVKPQQSRVWGTYDAHPVDDRGDPVTGPVATPWFDVRGKSEVVFWSLGRLGPPDRLRAEVVVEQGGRDTKIARRASEPPVDTPWWAYHRVRLSPHAQALRLVMTDGDPGDGSWLATTAPFVPRYTSFTDVSEHAAVWRNPNAVLAMPCRPLPSAADGVLQPFRWSLGPPAHNGAAIAAEYPTIERGCLHPRLGGDAPDRRFCAFEFVSTS